MENSMKSISPAIMQNKESPIVEAHPLFIDLKVGVSLDHGVSLYFVLLLALGQRSKQIRSAPASSALTLVSLTLKP